MDIRACLLRPWGSDGMSDSPVSAVVPLAKGIQILNLIKENQLITAVILFIAWQAGAFAQVVSIVGCA